MNLKKVLKKTSSFVSSHLIEIFVGLTFVEILNKLDDINEKLNNIK